jgi:ABC-type cobalt transport system substrate-binding protein
MSPSEKGHWCERKITRCEKPVFNPVSKALFIPSVFTCPSKSGENLGKPSSVSYVLGYISTTFRGYRKRCEVIESTLALGTYRSWFQPHVHPTSGKIPSDVSFELDWLSTSLIFSRTGSKNWQIRTHTKENLPMHTFGILSKLYLLFLADLNLKWRAPPSGVT